MERESH